MDEQLKQSALDFHEFPVPGKIRGLADQTSRHPARSGAGLLAGRRSPPAPEIEKDPLAAYKYTARGNLGGGRLQRHRGAGARQHRRAGR